MPATQKVTKAAAPAPSKRKAGHAPEIPVTAANAKPVKFSEFTTKWRANVTEELTERFNGFLKSALPEEKAFLKEALFNWESRSTTEVHGYQEHELPFLTAISEVFDGMHLVPVQSAAMVEEVEQFITAKIEAGWKVPKYKPTGYAPESPEALAERTRKLLARHVDYFTYYCRQEEIVFMIDLMEQWETIYANEKTREGTKYPIAAAAEIQLDVMRRHEEWFQEYECRKQVREGA